jgi:hypothetical protein
MAAPVWKLTVDLETKTATFTTGLADAAKSARGAFGDIKDGAAKAGRETSFSMMEARHSVMLTAEEFGVHIPRALAGFIASLGPVGPALEEAFPFLAVIALGTMLIEHLKKIKEAGEKLTEDQERFGIAVSNTFNGLDQKMLQAEKRADELKNDHLGALHHELQLIDLQSLAELVHSFEEVAKAADVVMKDLEGHWYTFGKGSEGAKHALDDFKIKYDALLAESKGDEASGLLHGTLGQAQRVLDLLEQVQKSGRQGGNPFAAFADPAKFHAAADELQRLGVAFNPEHVEKQVEAQQNLVNVLNAQVGSEQRIAALKGLEKGNATGDANKQTAHDTEERAKQEAEALKAGREQYMRELFEQDKRLVEGTQQTERDKIDATRAGSEERLQAVEEAIHEEEAMGLQETAFYRTLYKQRFDLQNQLQDEADKRNVEAARESARHTEQMGMLSVAADRQHLALVASTRRSSVDQQMADAILIAREEYAIKMHALADEEAGLDKSGKEYANKLKQIHNREKELIKQHEQEITDIKVKAEIDRNLRIQSAEHQLMSSIAQGLTQSIMGHQTWARTLMGLGDQLASAMMENAIKSALAMDFGKDKDAAHAARKAFTKVMDALPFPANAIVAPIAAVGAFTSVMAFESGTDRVPGLGRGDTVPTMLTPGEGVVPGGVMDGLRNVARNGGFERGPSINVRAHFAPTVHALDADGVDKILKKHGDKFQRHFENTLRRMNK